MSMKNFLWVTSLLLLANLLMLADASSSELKLEDGEWEMTSQMEMEGMPAMPSGMPPMTYRQCIAEDKMIPAQQNRNQDCEKIKQFVSGNTVTWSMRCTTNGQVSDMNGTATYSGDTMNGTMHMTSQGMKMTSHVSGKRLGPCK